jgi:hypothetical protein
MVDCDKPAREKICPTQTPSVYGLVCSGNSSAGFFSQDKISRLTGFASALMMVSTS